MGNRPRSEPLPTGPFIAWIERELAQLEANDTLRGDNMRQVPAMSLLAARLGTDPRVVRRYRNGLVSSRRKGITGDYPTETFPRAAVEDMLEHAGVPFFEVYPDVVDDIELERDEFCPTCREVVTPIDGQCPWCDAIVRRPDGDDAGARASGCTFAGCERNHYARDLCKLHYDRQIRGSARVA